MGPISHPRDVPVGPDQYRSGSSDVAEHRKLPGAAKVGIDQLDPIRPRRDVESTGFAEVEQDRLGLVKQGEDPTRPLRGDQVEIGHATTEHRVSLAELVVNVQAGHHRGVPLARLLHAQQVGNGVAQGIKARVAGAGESDLRHRVAQHAGSDRVAFVVIGVQKAVRRHALDHLGQLPPQVHRILHAGVESLPAHRGVHVRGVAGQQDTSLAVGRGLTGHVGEPGDPDRTVHPVVGPIDGDDRLAEIAQGGFAGGSDVLVGHHDPDRSVVGVDDLAVADLVLDPAEAVDAAGVLAGAQLRLLGHLDLGDQGAGRRIPPGELDAGLLADEAASSVAPDEVLRPQRLAVGQLDVDAGVVLREPRHLTFAVDGHGQLVDPAGQDALDVVLPQPEPVGMPRREVADVERDPSETRDLGHLSLREEPIGDATLIEDLDGSCVQTAGARAGEVLAGAPLDDGSVDPRQRQLAGQHQPRGPSPNDQYGMLGHSPALRRSAFESAILRHEGGLAASPPPRVTLEMRGAGGAAPSFLSQVERRRRGMTAETPDSRARTACGFLS